MECVDRVTGLRVRRVEAPGARELQGLADVLIDCVEGGASVSFMLPMTRAKAEAYWQEVAAHVARGTRLLVVAEDAAGTILGTTQVLIDQPENQPHRADVAKMLVRRSARRSGVGAALLRAAEQAALAAGRTLLVLDTASSDAERLYARHGWQRCGVIPDYALWPGGGFCPTTVFFKSLHRAAQPAPAPPSTDKE